MALLVLLSTVSFTVEKHFCGDFLVETSYFGTTDGCDNQSSYETCHQPSSKDKKGCCKDKIEKIEGQDDLQQETYKTIELEKHTFLLAFITSYHNLFLENKPNIVSYKQYYLPYFKKNLQILLQSFII